MMYMQTNKHRFATLPILILLSIGAAIDLRAAEQAGAKDSAVGELKLEGQHIERLVLRRKDGQNEHFNDPGEMLTLPVGQYHVMESHLSGGYTCFQGPGPNAQWITVRENEPALLKVGAPLKRTLQATRRGKVLVLDYKLLGAGGESYTNRDRSKPPTFTIYRGDKQVASGKFEFG
jgi:hypothetical protein